MFVVYLINEVFVIVVGYPIECYCAVVMELILHVNNSWDHRGVLARSANDFTDQKKLTDATLINIIDP